MFFNSVEFLSLAFPSLISTAFFHFIFLCYFAQITLTNTSIVSNSLNFFFHYIRLATVLPLHDYAKSGVYVGEK